jgi:hypothetical protein
MILAPASPAPDVTLADLLRQAFDGVLPACPDLARLIDGWDRPLSPCSRGSCSSATHR